MGVFALREQFEWNYVQTSLTVIIIVVWWLVFIFEVIVIYRKKLLIDEDNNDNDARERGKDNDEDLAEGIMGGDGNVIMGGVL